MESFWTLFLITLGTRIFSWVILLFLANQLKKLNTRCRMIMPLRLGHISTIKEVNLSIWVMWSVEFFSIFLIPIHHVPLQICCRGLVTKYCAMRSASNFAICFPLTIIHSLLHSFMALCWNLLPSGTVWIKTWQGFETHTKMQQIGMTTNLLNHQYTCKWFCANLQRTFIITAIQGMARLFVVVH